MKKISLLLLFLCLVTNCCSGCSKEEVLDVYREVNEKVGDTVLTSKYQLKGKREFGENHYTGTYEVEYRNFKGEEVLFGGTTIERENSKIHIILEIENSKGNLNILMKLKEQEEPLASKDGTYEFDFDIKDGSNYLIVKADDYSGKVKITIEEG